MITYNGIKLTANQFAKALIFTYGYAGSCNLEDFDEFELEDMTAKEQQQIKEAVDRQLHRVYDFLNLEKINGPWQGEEE